MRPETFIQTLRARRTELLSAVDRAATGQMSQEARDKVVATLENIARSEAGLGQRISFAQALPLALQLDAVSIYEMPPAWLRS